MRIPIKIFAGVFLCMGLLLQCEKNGTVFQLALLNRAMALWRSHQIQHYFLVQSVTCFGPEITSPYILEIQDGKIVRAVDFNLTPLNPSTMAKAKSVEQLFQWIQELHQKNIKTFNVEYDRKYGYPISVYVDFSPANDGEIHYFTQLSFTFPYIR